MPKIRTVVVGGVVGAALVYLFDPRLGPERRARLGDQLGAAVRRSRSEVERVARRVEERAQGAMTHLEHAVEPRPADDLTILDRVESVLYGMPDFPKGSVTAEVVDGRLLLRGEVRDERQASDIVAVAARVPGVAAVENELHVNGVGSANRG
jgi:osmotically-inducible protein OsmY